MLTEGSFLALFFKWLQYAANQSTKRYSIKLLTVRQVNLCRVELGASFCALWVSQPTPGYGTTLMVPVPVITSPTTAAVTPAR